MIQMRRITLETETKNEIIDKSLNSDIAIDHWGFNC